MRPWLHVSACLLAVGCVTTSVQQLEHPARPARFADAVTVLLEKPQQPYTVIAVIEATGQTVFDSFGDLRSEMIAIAAQLGGEALVLGPESTDSQFIITGTAMIKSDRKKLTGEVIVYDEVRESRLN